MYMHIFSYRHFNNCTQTLVLFKVICTVFKSHFVPFQYLLEGPMEALFCEHFTELRNSLSHLLNHLISTAYELTE